MTTYTIFGTGTPAGISISVDGSEISVSTAFYVLGVSGWKVKAIRTWVPAGGPAPFTGHKAYLWIGTSNTPDSILATANFDPMIVGWNEATFASPISLIAGRFYWAQVYYPTGKYAAVSGKFTSSALVSVDTPSLFAAGTSEVTTGQGSYVLGTFGQAPTSNFGATWYGVDVLLDDTPGGSGIAPAESVGIADNVMAVRSGLPSTVHASGSATDNLGATTLAAVELPIGSATAFHTVRRRLFETRVSWGSVVTTNIRGPTFARDAVPALTLGLSFWVLWPCRFVGGKIYKPPDLAGTIPVRLWDKQGVDGAPRELGNVTMTWVADSGGWRDVPEFSPAIELVPDVEYTMSYYSPTADYAYSSYVFHVWSDVVPPFQVRAWKEPAGTPRINGSAYHEGTAQVIPDNHVATNYYIEPMVEWDSNEPVYVPDPDNSYYDQWVNGRPNYKFAIGIFNAGAQYIQQYADMGINLVVGAPASVESTTNAIKAAGINQFPSMMMPYDPERLGLRNVAEDAGYSALVTGYEMLDEPDQFFPYTPPEALRGWFRDLRLIDSTRPLKLTMGRVVGINQTFYHQPQGATMDQANQLWRDWAQLSDIMEGDMYTLAPDQDPELKWGVWTYPLFTRRLRQLNEGRTPVWLDIETTSETKDEPIPGMVVKACWAGLIEGANGLIFFDYRFGNAFVARDFQHMLHNPPMKAAVSAMIVRIIALADALNSPNTNIVTAVTSSNTTAGPLGGTWGVPMHYCTKADASHEYLLAMGIRPGSTTATFTIPSWAGATITVLDESRTLVVSGAGVLTDSFPADYTVHIYQK